VLNTKGDQVRLKDFRVECIIGVYRAERLTPQWVELDLTLYLDTRPAAATGDLEASIDYARLCGEIRFLLESCHFRLLEEAAQTICAYVLAPPTQDAGRCAIDAVTLELTKPAALGEVATPSVRVHRETSDFSLEVEEKDFGRVDIVSQGRDYGVYRLRIAPGCAIPTHVHRRMEEHELVLGSGLHLQRRPIAAGSSHSWPLDFAHRYDNPSQTEQTVLCVDRPPFIPEDEVLVEDELGDLALVPSQSYYPREEIK
jgi:dihydroneopterin aldolase